MKPETKVVHQILDEIKAHCREEGQGYFIKIHGSAYQVSGIPDIVGVYHGRFVAFEVKMPDKEGTVSRRQALAIIRIVKAGGIAKVVTSAHEAMSHLRKLDKTGGAWL